MIQSIPSAASSAPGGAVGGASNLTTAGAVPYVASAGVLTEDVLFQYSAATSGMFIGVGRLTASSNVAIESRGVFGVTGGANAQPTGVGGVFINYSSANIGYISSVTSGTAGRELRISGYPLAFVSAQTGSELARFSTGGNLLLGTTTDGNYKLDIAASGSSGTLRVYDQTVTTGSTSLVVRAGAGQSGNLTTWQNSSGTEIASVGSTGAITSTTQINLLNSTSFNTAVAVSNGSSFADSQHIFRAYYDAASPTQFILGSYKVTGGTRLPLNLNDGGNVIMGIPKFVGTNSTGAGSALLGANSPASTLTAPYTWITVITSDGSTGYIPVWK